jgi:uncharacterized protein (DUF488 family)
MRTIHTIGYQRKSLSTFIQQLQEAGVDVIIDVRLRNTSHLAGYTKRDTLAFLLEEGFDIAYEHHPELAPTDAIFDAYKANSDWAAYETAFLPLLAVREADAVGREILDRHHRPCLLCAEASAGHCHRRLVVEYWADRIPDLDIIHL